MRGLVIDHSSFLEKRDAQFVTDSVSDRVSLTDRGAGSSDAAIQT